MRKKTAAKKNAAKPTQVPEGAAVFEWRKVELAETKPDAQKDDEPLSHGAALLKAATAYRTACAVADMTIRMRDTAERRLLDLASGKLADGNAKPAFEG